MRLGHQETGTPRVPLQLLVCTACSLSCREYISRRRHKVKTENRSEHQFRSVKSRTLAMLNNPTYRGQPKLGSSIAIFFQKNLFIFWTSIHFLVVSDIVYEKKVGPADHRRRSSL